MPVAIERLRLIDSNLGVIAPIKDRRFRFFVDRANLDVTNLSSGFRHGPAKATLTGRFLGTGSAHGSATFRDDAQRRRTSTSCWRSTRRACRRSTTSCAPTASSTSRRGPSRSTPRSRSATAGSTATSSRCSRTSRSTTRKQDKNKPVLKKLYEKVVGGVAHVLENHKNDQVATVADLSGPLSSAQHQHLGDHRATWSPTPSSRRSSPASSASITAAHGGK